MQPLLNLEQAAALLGYSTSGFRKLLNKKLGPRCMRVGRGQFRFRPEWLVEYVEAAAEDQPARKTTKRQKGNPSPSPSVEPRHGFDPALFKR